MAIRIPIAIGITNLCNFSALITSLQKVHLKKMNNYSESFSHRTLTDFQIDFFRSNFLR